MRRKSSRSSWDFRPAHAGSRPAAGAAEPRCASRTHLEIARWSGRRSLLRPDRNASRPLATASPKPALGDERASRRSRPGFAVSASAFLYWTAMADAVPSATNARGAFALRLARFTAFHGSNFFPRRSPTILITSRAAVPEMAVGLEESGKRRRLRVERALDQELAAPPPRMPWAPCPEPPIRP